MDRYACLAVPNLPPPTLPVFRFGMFHRRLIALGLIVLVAFTAIGARLYGLTVIEGRERLEEAEARLGRTRLLPTIRGRILDRQGRVLAEVVPAYGLAIEYRAIDGSWTRNEARRIARAELGRATWNSLTPRGRELTIERFLPVAQARLDSILDEACAIAGLDRRELEARMAGIAEAVSRRVDAVRARQRDAWIARHGLEAVDRFRPEPIAEERQAHEVAGEISDSAAFALRRLADEHPGVIAVTDSARRVNPWHRATVMVDRSTLPSPIRRSSPISVELDGVAEAIIGRCRDQVWREDVARRPFMRAGAEVDLGGYLPGADLVGHSGIERTFEDSLRGVRGRVVMRIDSGAEERTPPEPGRDVELSIDIVLQARLEALLDPRVGLTQRQVWHDAASADADEHAGGLAFGTPLAAAAVVVDVDLGEILACASWPPPGLASVLPPGEASRLAPGIHRGFEGIYSPGSILKPLTYLAATAEGVFPVDGTVACTGHFFPENPTVARCWIHRPRYHMTTHSAGEKGPLGPEEALARSCNIYFYTLAQRLGAERLTAWLRRFGLGAPLGVGLRRPMRLGDGREVMVGESAGVVPGEEALARMRSQRDALTPIILGIGQGPMAWTPLHAANAYATIAREGVVRDAVLVRRVGGEPWIPPERGMGSREADADLHLPPRAVDHVLRGLRQAIEASWGTGHHLTFSDGSREPIFSIPGVRVLGKTGTAQAPPLRLDLDGDGVVDRTVTDLDHAWFVGLVGDARRARPRYAVAVLVEYGGSGGKVAGPLAAQVIRALQQEGYLVGDGASPEEAP